MRALMSYAGAALDWFSLRHNRRTAYKTARLALPLLVAAGLLTQGVAGDVLTVLGLLAGVGSLHLAAKHT